MEKTKARSVYGSTFPGFTFIPYGKTGKLGMIVPRKKKLEGRIRLITKRNRGVSIEVVIKEPNSVLRGWIGYFSRSIIKGLP